MKAICFLNTFNIMAQATMTVRTDAALKTTFDSLCRRFGMSTNTAMNIFMRAVVDTRSIPFRIGTQLETNDIQLQKLLEENRQYRVSNNLPEMSLEEINTEIANYRAERASKQKIQMQ